MSFRRALVLGSIGSVLLPAAHAKTSMIKVQIGAEDDWRPYAYTLAGKPMGFSVELVQAAWAAAGVEVELVALPYARCMREVEAGKLPACFNTLRDARTEDKYLWHRQPLFRARIGIYGRTDGPSDQVSLQSLNGKRIGVTNGYDYGSAFDDDPAMVRDVANSDLTSLRKLAAGRVDYALVYDRVANEIAVNNLALAQQFRLRGTLQEVSLYVSFSKRFEGAAALAQKFDAGLETIRKNGEYARIEARWR
ncbi:MAG: transporter substrate-binding domain-containing protein [Rhodoferax sp.]|uniref:substrate-binding periplasmic protein n=1 Tax=Rhodoferax sp. TaxID=50421 RepID=UPI002ACD239B|nr:transporter substrate-binding domain-containing protein [Rhodoferax sp.]MDZ7891589.1 transporter substrate-binding domain-containing protein [Rhodoferax sp.]